MGRDHEARDAGKRAAQDARPRDGPVDVHAHQRCRPGIVGHGPVGAAERGAADRHDGRDDRRRGQGGQAELARAERDRPEMQGTVRAAAASADASRRAAGGPSANAIARPIVAISSACELRRWSGANTRRPEHLPQRRAGRSRRAAKPDQRQQGTRPAVVAPSRTPDRAANEPTVVNSPKARLIRPVMP